MRGSVCPSWHLHILGQLASPLLESVVIRAATMLGADGKKIGSRRLGNSKRYESHKFKETDRYTVFQVT